MSLAQKTPIQVLQNAWKRIAPLELADNSWDNVGVMIEAPFPKSTARKILLTIDLTADVCSEALKMDECSLILSYHPPIFSGLKSLKLSNPLQASLLKLSAKGISVFSPHTSLDSIDGGINSWLSSAFKDLISSSHPIQPTSPSITSNLNKDEFHNTGETGMGRLIKLQGDGVGVEEALKRVKGLLGMKYVQYARPSKASNTSGQIKTIALCAGSGGSMFKNLNADLYWTGEMTHHQVLAFTQEGAHTILCNHTNTERGYLRNVLKEKLSEEMNAGAEGKGEGEGGQWEVVVSEEDRDPLEVV